MKYLNYLKLLILLKIHTYIYIYIIFIQDGGRGGGLLKFNISNNFEISGIIEANGIRSDRDLLGGGSGGSIIIHTQSLYG